MPIYEYRCSKCETRFERIQKFSDHSESECPECGAAGERLLSAPAIQFKGSGWYVTDYARKGSGGSDGDKPQKDAKKDSAGKKDSPAKDKASTASKDSKTSKSSKPSD